MSGYLEYFLCRAWVRTVGGMLLVVILAGCSERATPVTANAPGILLFSGTGTSPNDVAAIEIILRNNRLSYVDVNSTELNTMSELQIRAFRLLIVPGGDFVAMGDSLTAATTTRVHDAVNKGLNYLGVCAGAFLASDLRPPYKAFNLTSGARFAFYSAEQSGIHRAAVRIITVESFPLDVYWEDGPDLSGWGETIARYPDGHSAVTEGTSGIGWVILLGIHPEAPGVWRRGMRFSTPVSASNQYALHLIDAALNAKHLPSL